jgi:hypothetical protein
MYCRGAFTEMFNDGLSGINDDAISAVIGFFQAGLDLLMGKSDVAIFIVSATLLGMFFQNSHNAG